MAKKKGTSGRRPSSTTTRIETVSNETETSKTKESTTVIHNNKD